MLSSPSLPEKELVSLRLVSSAGEALPADLGIRFTEHFGVEIIDGIESTEMLHIFLSNRPGKVRFGTTGWPVLGYEIKLIGDNRQQVNEDGSYTYSGRSDDMIKVSGVYVSPFEVEATLIQHPAVLESAVIGVVNEDGLTVT